MYLFDDRYYNRQRNLPLVWDGVGIINFQLELL